MIKREVGEGIHFHGTPPKCNQGSKRGARNLQATKNEAGNRKRGKSRQLAPHAQARMLGDFRDRERKRKVGRQIGPQKKCSVRCEDLWDTKKFSVAKEPVFTTCARRRRRIRFDPCIGKQKRLWIRGQFFHQRR